ncbi:deadpan [Lycorma delicatula]|uniref:deadpan n=1 Tax=Lycorma delicatula TaxID=130591 RepID=UPI003F516D4F
MEKRRRARINHCLNELKTLILDAMKKDPARHSKLEKADILEMTVKHLQTIQRQQLSTAVGTDPTVLHKFKNGFNECATEVSRYINHMEGIENCVKQRLVSHLASCVSGLQQISPQLTSTYQGTNSNNNNNSNNSLFLNNTSNNLSQQNSSISSLSEDVNNNHASSRLQSMMTSLQLIPSRLPTGELALLLPNSQQLPGNVLPFFPPPPPNVVTSTTSTMLQQSQLPVPSNDSGENIHNHYRNHPIPSTTTTSETTPINTIDRMQHISAFTAVCRPTMIKDNQRNYSLTKSPMVSPTSSITSSSSINYDDTTPPKTITDMSPNTSVSSEISSTSLLQIENNIKNKNSNFLTTKLTTPPVLAVKPLPLLKENNNFVGGRLMDMDTKFSEIWTMD